MGAIQNSPQACILFRCCFLGETRESTRERASCGLVGWLLDGRKASFGHSVGWFPLNWNRFFGGFWEDFRINHWHCIAEAKSTEEILISFWMWKLFFFKVASSPLQNDWFLAMSTGIIFKKTIRFFSPCCGWKVFIDVIFPIRLNWPKSDIKHYSLRRFEKGQSWKLQWPCQPAACQSRKSPKSSNKDGKYGAVHFSPGWTGTVTHQTTEMSSAQFAAGHVFYKHFPPCCFLAFLTITLLFSQSRLVLYRTSMYNERDGPERPSRQSDLWAGGSDLLAVRPRRH